MFAGTSSIGTGIALLNGQGTQGTPAPSCFFTSRAPVRLNFAHKTVHVPVLVTYCTTMRPRYRREERRGEQGPGRSWKEWAWATLVYLKPWFLFDLRLNRYGVKEGPMREQASSRASC